MTLMSGRTVRGGGSKLQPRLPRRRYGIYDSSKGYRVRAERGRSFNYLGEELANTLIYWYRDGATWNLAICLGTGQQGCIADDRSQYCNIWSF